MMEQSEIMTRYEQIVLNLLEDNEKLKSHVKQLESALKFMIRNEEVNEALAKAAGESYVNKGLDFARTLVVMEKKNGLP
jgi:hypothetical protein